jgi:hypothetical protein
MPNYIEERLKHDLKVLATVYVASFPHSFSKFIRGPADFLDDLEIYESLIEEKYFEIRRGAVANIQRYCNLYGIMPTNGVDEFKSIYYLGRAIETQLLANSYVRMAQVHMFTMIGLMDEKLNSQGVFKDQLVEKLAAIGVVDSEANIRNKLSRGKFTAVLLIQCLEAIGSTSLRLD